MAIDNTGISSLDAGASDITYSGDEGPKSPEQQLMASADPMLVEEYNKYVFEMEEQGLQPISFREFVEQIMAESRMASGGIADIGFSRVQPSEDGSRPGYFTGQRRQEQRSRDLGSMRGGVGRDPDPRPTTYQNVHQTGAVTQTPGRPTYQNVHDTGAVTQTPGRPPVTTGGASPFPYTRPQGITSNYMNPTFRKATIDRIKQYQLANRPPVITGGASPFAYTRPNQLETWQSMFGDDETDVLPVADLKAEKIYESEWGKTPIQWDKIEPGSADMFSKQFNKVKDKYETWGDLYQAGLEGKLGIANAQILTQNKEGFKTLAKELPDAGGNLDVEDQFTDWDLQDLYEQKSGTRSYSLNLPLIGETGVKKGGTGTGLALREADEFLTKEAEAELRKAGWLAEGGIARLGYDLGGNVRQRPHQPSDLLVRNTLSGERPKYQPPGHATVAQSRDYHDPSPRRDRDPDPVGGDQEADVARMMESMNLKDDPGGPASRMSVSDIHGEWDDPGSVSYDPTYDPVAQSLATKKSAFIGKPINLPDTPSPFWNMGLNFMTKPFSWGSEVNRRFFVNKVLGSKNYANINWEDLSEEELEEAYQKYMKARQMGDIDAYGNPSIPGEGPQEEWQRLGYPSYAAYLAAMQGAGGGITTPLEEDTVIPTDPVTATGLANQFTIPGWTTAHNPYSNLASNIWDPATSTLTLANGGRAEYAGGGIADLRQGYFLGDLVKGITKPFKGAARSIKKFAKSDIGKMAIMAALMGAPFGGGAGAKWFGPGSGWGKLSGGKGLAGLKDMWLGKKNIGALTGKGPISWADTTRQGGIWNWMKGHPWQSIVGLSALGGLYTGMTDDDDEDDMYKKWLAEKAMWNQRYSGISDPANLQPITFADGGRIGYAEGGNNKDLTHKQKYLKGVQYAQEGGLMDLGGMEKDYRQEGGFVPLGGEERADDVPARLSKNEFVFTADAVRAAGGGDIDAGAEVMENVMENLEQGGQVSEESQGLEGARNMFATAQRLEGVL